MQPAYPVRVWIARRIAQTARLLQSLNKMSRSKPPMRRITPRTLGGIALLATLLGISVASVWAEGPASPGLRVDVTTHNPDPNNGGFDSILLVSVPHQRPFTPPRFNLLQSFVVQSIDLTQKAPDGTSATTNLITCTLSSSPAYPSR